jgi:hypothetical protein
MVYDFYGKFSEIYPINLEDLKNPDREKWGYFWDMEDYMFENKNSRGLLIQGIILNTPEDFENYVKIFSSNLRKTIINSLMKMSESLYETTDLVFDDRDISESIEFSIFKNFKDEIHNAMERRNSYLDGLKTSIKRGSIWISLNNYWTELVKKETEDFWGKDTRVLRLPECYSVMNRKDLWEETLIEGIKEFGEERIWEDFAYKFPHLVKYMDHEIRNKIGVNFLKRGCDLGLF